MSMRRPASILLCACLSLSYARPSVASEPPAELPDYDAAAEPVASAPKDPSSVPLMITGGVLLNIGALSAITGLALWRNNARYWSPEPSTLPGVGIGIGGILMTIGATFLSVGVKRHKRALRASSSPYVQIQPLVGPTQFGVTGRF